MRNSLLVIRDPLERDSWEESEFEGSVCEHLATLYPEWPVAARLYHEHVSDSTEVTPTNDQDIAALDKLQGRFFVVHYPQGFWAMVAVFVVSLLIAVTFKPKVPNAALRNTTASSPNNELSARVNSARPNGRIPDIFGTVRSTPDLIALPYSTFTANIEIENAVMCIGRGQYEIHDCYDGDTPVAEIDGTSVEVYHPHTDIFAGAPYFSVGPAILEAPLNVMRSNSVNGQTLKAGNAESYVGNNDVWFHNGGDVGIGVIHFFKVNNVTEQFEVGDEITITGASKIKASATYDVTNAPLATPLSPTTFYIESPAALDFDRCDTIEFVGAIFPTADTEDSEELDLSGTVDFVSVVASGAGFIVTFTNPSNASWAGVATDEYSSVFMTSATFTYGELFNLNGTYTILAMTTSPIEPLQGLNVLHVAWTAAWDEIPTDVVGGGTGPMSPTIGKAGETDIGPFYLDMRDGDIVMANFVAPHGIYKDNGFTQTFEEVTVELVITPVDSANVPTGAAQVASYTLTGSSLSRDIVGITARVAQTVPGRCSVIARRTSLTDRTYEGQVVDEVKWRDLYHAHEMDGPNFGNVTVLRSRTAATTGALSVKERKLNMEVTRQVAIRVSGTTFGALASTNNAAEIFSHVCMDPMIGNRSASEIDFDNIYDTVAEIAAYFGSNNAIEFCYTIDKPEMTFEDTVASIAQAIFSTAYRRGSVIRISFEKQTDDSTLLFNHRNKIPGSETRTVRFGYDNNFDGVEYKWVNPEDDALETLTIGAAPINPRKIESIGIRNEAQAYWHAWRQWNKIRYQNVAVEFTATAQADLAVVGDRILVADNTRSNSQDGDIVEVDGLIVHTSQKLTFEPAHTYTMFLQLYDGTVEAIAVTEVVGEPYQATLALAPSLPLVTDLANYARTKYKVADDAAPMRHAFLLTERENQSSNTAKVSAINYDARYYSNDTLAP